MASTKRGSVCPANDLKVLTQRRMTSTHSTCSKSILRGEISKMSQALPLPPAGFDALSVDEQIDYVQSLWDHIAAKPERVPVPDWHREILTERLATHHADNDQGKNWEEFEKDLIAELSERTS